MLFSGVLFEESEVVVKEEPIELDHEDWLIWFDLWKSKKYEEAKKFQQECLKRYEEENE